MVMDVHKEIGSTAKGMAAQAKIHTRNNVGASGKIYFGTKQGVPGEGPATAEIMFVGEGPGADDDIHATCRGRPVVRQRGHRQRVERRGTGGHVVGTDHYRFSADLAGPETRAGPVRHHVVHRGLNPDGDPRQLPLEPGRVRVHVLHAHRLVAGSSGHAT